MLTKMDASLGIITHGLLMQRKHFADGIQHIMETHPEATEDLLKVFSGDDSKFKSFSDVLLQYVCGKRAEIIEARRKLYEFEKGSISQMMRDIPPSENSCMMEIAYQSFSSKSLCRGLVHTIDGQQAGYKGITRTREAQRLQSLVGLNINLTNLLRRWGSHARVRSRRGANQIAKNGIHQRQAI
nr:unnamed protein product [Callosobruchus analis]